VPYCLIVQVQINPVSYRSIVTNKCHHPGDCKNDHTDRRLQQTSGQDNPPPSHLQRRYVLAIQSDKSLQPYLFHFNYNHPHSKPLDTKPHNYSCLDTCQYVNIPQCNRAQLILTHSRKTLQPIAKARDPSIHIKKSTTHSLHTISPSLCTYPVKQMSNSRHSHEAEQIDTEDSTLPSHKWSTTSDPDH
jgi:hypothetical protein